MSLELDKLVIRDYQCFSGEHTFQFNREPGVYLIQGKNLAHPGLGPNGCGKSTLFGAMYWCIYGSTIRLKVPADDVTPWDGGKPDVWLRFYRDGVKHIINRTRKPITLTLDGKEVNQETIDNAVGLNASAFMRTLFLGQFAPLFLDLTANEQSALFNDALGLQLWLAASDEASTRRRDADRAVGNIRERLQGAAGRLDEANHNLVSDERAAGDYRDRMVADLAKARDRLAKAKKAADSGVGPDAVAIRRKQLDITRKLARATGDVRAWGEQARDLTADIETYAATLKNTKPVCPECGQKVGTDHIKTKLKQLRDQLAHTTKQKADADQQASMLHESNEDNLAALDKAAVEEKRYRTQWAEVDAARLQVVDIEARTKINPFKENIVRHNRRIVELDKEVDREEKLLTAAEQEAGDCALWSDAFKKIRLALVDDTLTELEVSANRQAEALGLAECRVVFATERERKSGKVTAEFTTLLYPFGRDKPVRFEAYSGGESQRWQLAASFGLSEVLLSRAGLTPNVEIIDEPTQHLTDIGIDDLLECLETRARELRRQIYFIDHRSLNRAAFAGVITVTHNHGGSSIGS